ncbi:MAG: chromate transporter [Tissierellaceae bacterium]|nr:chromate transporter [Tissierellaceae bacterium]
MSLLLQLFISFFKIGAFSFGGGYAMLPLLEKELVEKHQWISTTDFIDILAISEMTPGPIAINSATFLGYRVAGILGAFFSTFAVVLPSFIVVTLIFKSISRFKNSPYVSWVLKGLRPVVLGLIAAAAITVGRTSFVDIKSVLIAILIFFLVSIKKLNAILAIIIAGILGVILY